MSDSTSVIDATAIIIIDSTATDAQNLSATVANSLVGDFASSMGPIAAKCDKLAAQKNSISDGISGMIPTPTSLLDQVLANGLNAAYQSSAWAMASEASAGIKSALEKCDYFKEAADKASKYGDPSKFLKSLASAAVGKAGQAIDAIIDKFKLDIPGSTFPELGIGKALSDMADTGRAVYDKVQTQLEDVTEALSPIIEYGKAAINTAQNELSAASKELGKLDKLVQCLDNIGGSDYAGAIDEMNDQLNCYYDKLGTFSDSALPNFGEFDFESYLGGIGAIAGNPSAINNIKKAVNLYSKAKNNAEGAISKASDLGIKTPSALDPSGASKKITQKIEYAESASKTSYTVPGIPGKTETKTVTLPPPTPVSTPPIAQGDPPDPEPGKVAYANFIKETAFTSDDALYYTYDPGSAKQGQYLSDAYALINSKSVEEPSSPPPIKLAVEIIDVSFVVKNKEFIPEPSILNPEPAPEIIYTVYCLTGVRVALTNEQTHSFSFKSGVGKAVTDKWYTKSEVLKGNPTPEVRGAVMVEAIRNTIKSLSFSQSDIEGTLGF